MKLNKHLSSYPILISGDDDYIDSSFEIKIVQNVYFGKLIIEVDFLLNNLGLEQLIKSEVTKFALHIECPLLSYRQVFLTSENKLTIELDLNHLAENVEVSGFIVANQDIEHYYNEKFNLFYGKDGVNITKGNYLAIATPYTIDIDRTKEGNDKLSNFIVIQQDDNAKDRMNINLNGDVISILVNKQIKDEYFQHGKQYLYNCISMIMVPTMIYVLTNMQSNPDLQSYRWYKNIEKLLEQNDVRIEDLKTDESSGKNSIFEIAQKIFKSPLQHGLEELTLVSEKDE